MNYQVVIIEDDPMVAQIDRQYVEMNRAFHVMRMFKSSVDAIDWFSLGGRTVDLVILDYYTPGMTGQQFLDCLHEMGQSPSVIMVTSANDAQTVRELLSRGVLDYLVKPFRSERFQQALARFIKLNQALEKGNDVDQGTLDRLLGGETAGTLAPLEKGLNTDTLARIRAFFAGYNGNGITSEQIAEQVGLSRITVRRYVSYLAECGEIASFVDYQTGGRPCIRYTQIEAEKERNG